MDAREFDFSDECPPDPVVKKARAKLEELKKGLDDNPGNFALNVAVGMMHQHVQELEAE